MKLILVRHGESTWNKLKRIQGAKNPRLSDKGIKQSQLLANRFNEMRFDAVYSSHLNRAYQTAKILINSNTHICIIEDLQEIKLGVWEGKTIDQVSKEYKEIYDKWYQKPLEVKIPGAETILEFKNRVVRTIDGIKRQHPGQEVLVVTHGGVISIYLAHLLEMNLNKVWSISLKNGSVTIISFYEEFPSVLLFNDTCHLDSEEDLVTW
ncbi:MAG: histidine phosphatase family protein [bacterium]